MNYCAWQKATQPPEMAKGFPALKIDRRLTNNQTLRTLIQPRGPTKRDLWGHSSPDSSAAGSPHFEGPQQVPLMARIPERNSDGDDFKGFVFDGGLDRQ